MWLCEKIYIAHTYIYTPFWVNVVDPLATSSHPTNFCWICTSWRCSATNLSASPAPGWEKRTKSWKKSRNNSWSWSVSGILGRVIPKNTHPTFRGIPNRYRWTYHHQKPIQSTHPIHLSLEFCSYLTVSCLPSWEKPTAGTWKSPVVQVVCWGWNTTRLWRDCSKP